MKIIKYLFIPFSCLNMAHATHEDYKAMAHEAYGYVMDIKNSACQGDDTLSVSPQALNHLLKLQNNSDFSEDICKPKEQDLHCEKVDVPQSFKMELGAVTDCIQSYKLPHVPKNLSEVCCQAATHVANYLKTYLDKTSP